MEEMMKWVRYSKSIGWNFEGRARRSEYWWNYLYYMLISFGAAVLMCIIMVVSTLLAAILGSASDAMGNLALGITGILSILQMVVNLGVNIWATYRTVPILVRRMHDRGMSGWMYWIFMLLSCFCGIGSIILLVLLCMDGQPGSNKYGPNPKENCNYNRDSQIYQEHNR